MPLYHNITKETKPKPVYHYDRYDTLDFVNEEGKAEELAMEFVIKEHRIEFRAKYKECQGQL